MNVENTGGTPVPLDPTGWQPVPLSKPPGRMPVLRWLLLGHDAGDGVAVATAVDGEVFFVDGDELCAGVLLREGDKGGVGKVHAVVFVQ